MNITRKERYRSFYPKRRLNSPEFVLADRQGLAADFRGAQLQRGTIQRQILLVLHQRLQRSIHLLRFEDKISPAKTDIDLPMKSSSSCFCVPVSVNHQPKQWVRLDTGCATALQWVTSDADVSVKSEKPAIGLAGLSIPQTQTTISLGGKKFDQIPTGVHSHAIFAGEAGLLGNDFLSRFKMVTIDTKSARLVLSPM